MTMGSFGNILRRRKIRKRLRKVGREEDNMEREVGEEKEDKMKGGEKNEDKLVVERWRGEKDEDDNGEEKTSGFSSSAALSAATVASAKVRFTALLDIMI